MFFTNILILFNEIHKLLFFNYNNQSAALQLYLDGTFAK